MERPKTIMIMAQTVDGKIAKHSEHVTMDWTSAEDKKFFRTETKKHAALIVGKKTFDTFPGPLPNRLNVVLTRTPDTSLNQTGVLEYTNLEPMTLLAHLATQGIESVVIAGGAVTNKLFLEAGCVDELYLTIEPIIFGHGMCLCDTLPEDINLTLTATETLNDNTVLLKYNISN